VVRGEVRVNDGDRMVSVTKAAPEVLRKLRLSRIAMVFQQFGLLPWRTVRENVGLGLELAGLTPDQRRARVDAQLELVNLTPAAERKVGELSGGMQQRVGLARAFVTEAPILLMDEPFSALDPLIRTRLQDELLELQEKLKRTIIFVSHDLDEAFKIGDRIALMEGGRIFSNPVSDYVADFVNHMNPLGVLTARDAMFPLPGSVPSSGQVAPDMPIRAVMEMLKGDVRAVTVVDAGAPIGIVSREAVLARLLNPRGAVVKP
jgi:glycine betaine/proline transport system ATP-binding protein